MKDFGSYWFESGTPTFLIKTLQNQPLFLSALVNGKKADEAHSQIDASGCADRFMVSGKKMFKAGVVFSSEGRGMLGRKIKE